MSANRDYRKYAVLYVDDEEQALKYFRKGLDKEYRILTAPSVAEATAVLERENATVAVVITDQRMPGQFGVELLKRICAKWPHIVRVLVTAYSDIESAIESVNSGAIYKYLTKPTDLKTMKETIKGALDQFMDARQRDTLLEERLEVMQRMVVADRVQSLAMMAGGISHHLRNSMTALTCFLEEAAPSKPGETPAAPGPDASFVEQLWALARKEREHLMNIIQTVGQGVGQANYKLSDELEAAELLRRGVEAATKDLAGKTIEIKPAQDLPKLKVDAEAVTRLMRILVTYADRLGKGQAAIALSAAATPIAGAPGLTILVSAQGPNWSDSDIASFFTPFAFPSGDPSDLGMDLLSAFSIAYHHGGDVIAHAAAPAGPGFELRLPADPAAVRRPELQDGLMQKLITGMASPAAVSPPAAGGKAA